MEHPENTIVIEFIPDVLAMLLICSNVLVTVFATCGNVLAIIVARRSKLTSLFTKMCLMSLSLSDMLLTLTSTPTDLDQFMNCLHSWNFGELVCKILPFCQFVFLMANSFSLLALAVQRYWSTSILLASRTYNRAENPRLIFTATILGYIWLIPIGFAIPYLWDYKLNYYFCHYRNLLEVNDFDVSNDYYLDEEEAKISEASAAVLTCHPIPPPEDLNMNATLGRCLYDDNSTSTMAICQQTRKERTLLYHVATGLIMLAFGGIFIKTLCLIRRMRKLQDYYEGALPPRNLQNIELVQSIRKLLRCQRRGLRFIGWMIGLFIFCRLPFWIIVLAMEIRAGDDRKQVMLSLYFTFHLIASIKGAITPFLYARSSKALRANEYGIVAKASATCLAIPCRKFSFDIAFEDSDVEE